MNRKGFLLFLTCLICSVACYKESDNSTDTWKPEIPDYYVETDVCGLILDGLGQAISGAKINVGQHTVNSNELGFFGLRKIKTDAYQTHIKVSRLGYMDAYVSLQTDAGMYFSKNIRLNSIENPRFLHTDNSQEILISPLVRLNIPKGSLKKFNGEDYAGAYVLAYEWIETSGLENWIKDFGNPIYRNNKKENLILQPNYILKLMLRSSAAEELYPDAAIELYIKSNQPDLQALSWNKKLEWQLQSVQNTANSEMVIYWNTGGLMCLGKLMPAIKMQGNVASAVHGNLSTIPISVKANGNLVSQEYSSSTGFYRCWIPQFTNAMLEVASTCGKPVHEILIPIKENTHGEFNFIIPDKAYQLVHCRSTLVSDSVDRRSDHYYIYGSQYGKFAGLSNEQGEMKIDFYYCDESYVDVHIQSEQNPTQKVDFTFSTKEENFPTFINSSNSNVKTLAVFTVGGEQFIFTDCQAEVIKESTGYSYFNILTKANGVQENHNYALSIIDPPAPWISDSKIWNDKFEVRRIVDKPIIEEFESQGRKMLELSFPKVEVIETKTMEIKQASIYYLLNI